MKNLVQLQQEHVDKIEKLLSKTPPSSEYTKIKNVLLMQQRILKKVAVVHQKMDTTPPKISPFKRREKTAGEKVDHKIENKDIPQGSFKKNENPKESDNDSLIIKNKDVPKDVFKKKEKKGAKFDSKKVPSKLSKDIKALAKEGKTHKEISEKLWVVDAVIKKVLKAKKQKGAQKVNLMADNAPKDSKEEFES